MKGSPDKSERLAAASRAVSPARLAAARILGRCRQHHAFAQEVLDQDLHAVDLSPADRRLTTQLVYGVLRRRRTVDALLQAVVRRPRHLVEARLWELLRLGAYQLALLTQVPPHAAIFETVELAGALGRPKAKGFLNGILRAVSRLVTDEYRDSPSADSIPMEAGRYRCLRQPVLPAPAEHPVEYLAVGFSWPRWLAARWWERYGWEECLRLGFWFAGPAPLWLRSNPLRIEREALLAALAEAGVAASAGSHPQSVRLAEHAAIRELPGYDQGWFTVQDESAMWVATALDPPPGSRVLDLCAAPGGKTTHLAELMGNQGRIVACEPDAGRLARLEELCRRLGIGIVEPTLLQDEPPPGPFDAVLVDVPCSNTGVLGRRPEVRDRLKPDDFRRLVPLQTKLLLQAAERVRPGGAVVYSTCSIEPAENQAVVQVVCSALTDMVLEAEERQVPGQPADGGYWARLRRRGAAD
ncbi:MAG: hypothetical protein NZ700_13820 [Gemmataceae bacterium]|nr:hypothetical protein [Gemmataceae bacterium]MDW8266871.1 transcription antitermination factor NusB [Gemmataceae bacterium]